MKRKSARLSTSVTPPAPAVAVDFREPVAAPPSRPDGETGAIASQGLLPSRSNPDLTGANQGNPNLTLVDGKSQCEVPVD